MVVSCVWEHFLTTVSLWKVACVVNWVGQVMNEESVDRFGLVQVIVSSTIDIVSHHVG